MNQYLVRWAPMPFNYEAGPVWWQHSKLARMRNRIIKTMVIMTAIG